ncbi:MAG: hypothetical protein IPM74_02915 [Crocinitomicaceae bacterium]|nr:hypothetical protein [Crocinitomicaceae bacterium]MBK8924868.1 hypothetical protein [Crocinitomicaceae bacterium]
MKSGLLILVVLFSAFSFAQDKVILRDDFNNNSNHWQEFSDGKADIKVDTKRRMYQIDHKLKHTGDACTAWTEVNLDEKRNFRITAQLYKEKGVKNYGYGLLWGGTQDNYYSFLISPAGFYCVGKVVNGKWNDITPDWQETETVSCGNHAYNKLTVSKIGDTYHFEINDLKVATMKIGAFFGNKLGFNVNDKQKIMVDWIVVEYI